MRKFYLLLVAGMLCCHVLRAQSVHTYVLPNAETSFFSSGNLFVDGTDVWVAVQNGAYKFNGSGFEVLNRETGLLSDYVYSITRDADNKLWFMHGDGMSIRWPGDSIDWSYIRNPFWYMGGGLRRIENDLWHSGSDASVVGLTRIFSNGNSKEYHHVPVDDWDRNGIYMDVAKAKDGTYYAIDSAFLYKIAGEQLVKVDATFGVAEPNRRTITNLLIDRSDALYVAEGYHQSVVWVRRPGDAEFTILSHPYLENVKVNNIRQGRSGAVYFAIAGGLIIYQNDTWSRLGREQGFPILNVLDVAVDHLGNVWVSGNGDNGLSLAVISHTTPPQDLEKIHGVVYYDVNGDGKRNDGEPGVANQFISMAPSDGYAITNASGEFSYRPQKGANTISWVDRGEWAPGAGPVSYTFTSPEDNQRIFEFGVVMGPNDLGVGLTFSAMRPGFDGYFWVNVVNKGNQPTTSELRLEYSGPVQVTSSAPAATSTGEHMLRWSLPTLKPGEAYYAVVHYTVPVGTALGTLVTATASVPTLPGEIDVQDNTISWTQAITGSFDPNDKLVKEGILEDRYVEMGTSLHYTIRFQNTGTDTAFTVKVVDELDPRLDITSLEVLGTSHTADVSLDGRTLTFTFYDILLPDSTRDEPNSHGYIQYSIQPVSSMPEGTKVRNKASIYFDFNEPVVTNETVNTYVTELPSNNPTSTEGDLQAGVMTYPNPVRDGNLVIVSKNAEVMKGSVTLTSLAGSAMRAASLQGVRTLVDVKGVAPGMYVLKVENRGVKSTRKVVIIQE